MYKKFISLSLILFVVCNILFCSLHCLTEYLKYYSFSYNTSSAVMLNLSSLKNISKGFVDVCSTISDMLTDCRNNDKTVPNINKVETNYSFPAIFLDKVTFNCNNQTEYDLYVTDNFKFYSYVKKHIVDKPDRTSNIFLLLLLQILIYLIVLNMCKYFNSFYLDVNRITLSF